MEQGSGWGCAGYPGLWIILLSVFCNLRECRTLQSNFQTRIRKRIPQHQGAYGEPHDVPHGHRPLFIKQNLTYKTKPLLHKATDILGGGKADFFHRGSKFTDPISFISYDLTGWPWKCLCPGGFLQEGVPVGSSAGGSTLSCGLVWLLLCCHLCGLCWAVLKLVVLLGWMTFNQEPSWACGRKRLSGAAGQYWLASVWIREWQHRKGYLILFCGSTYVLQKAVLRVSHLHLQLVSVPCLPSAHSQAGYYLQSFLRLCLRWRQEVEQIIGGSWWGCDDETLARDRRKGRK